MSELNLSTGLMVNTMDREELHNLREVLEAVYVWEEMLKGINRDQWKEFGWDIVDPLREAIEAAEELYTDARDEARTQMFDNERIYDELYALQDEMSDMRDREDELVKGLKRFMREM